MVSKQNLLNLPVTLIQILVIAEFHDANASKHHLLAPLGILLKSKNTKVKATNKLHVLNYEYYNFRGNNYCQRGLIEWE